MSVPDHLVAEIVEGELFTSPRPRKRHERAQGMLYMRLRGRFDDGGEGPGEWWIVGEPELHLGADILVPDIAGWRRDRVPNITDTAWWDVAPDWICEVISPSTGRLDRVRKLPAYAKYGVAHAWIVDPAELTLEVYRLIEGHLALISTHEGDDLVRAEPFEAIELPLSALWLPA